MNHKQILSILVLMGLFTFMLVSAGLTADVTATVKAKKISVAVSDGTVDFGTVPTDNFADTDDLGQGQTVTNDGNVDIDINIAGDETTNWTLSPTDNGNEIFTMGFCNDDLTDCSNTANFTLMDDIDTQYTSFDTSVPHTALNTRELDLRINTPETTTHYDTETITVTVQAVEDI